MQRLKRFLQNNDGVSAVEFALVAPVMIAVFFGSMELSLVMQVDRKTTTAAATLGDLVAQASAMDQSQLDDIFAATELILAPNATQNMRQRVSSVIEDGGVVVVQWSRVYDRTGSTTAE
ncbi:MAG: TadE/TadG family type IV pilus assembly protein, partial [Pseudomonadota bacterium]